MLKGKYRVPHCTDCDRCQCIDCDRCQCIDYFYKSYYCCEENDTTQTFMELGVDYPHKTSPKWCPKRKTVNKSGSR